MKNGDLCAQENVSADPMPLLKWMRQPFLEPKAHVHIRASVPDPKFDLFDEIRLAFSESSLFFWMTEGELHIENEHPVISKHRSNTTKRSQRCNTLRFSKMVTRNLELQTTKHVFFFPFCTKCCSRECSRQDFKIHLFFTMRACMLWQLLIQT